MTVKIIYLVIPGLVAIAGNIIFYRIVKSRIDKSIEQYKITYAGIYKEKIDIHKEILRQLNHLKLRTHQYKYSGSQEIADELFKDFTKFIQYYSMNRPFLRHEILAGIIAFRKELQGCFENFQEYAILSKSTGIDSEIRQEAFNNFLESGNKLKKDEPFKQIEDLLISEMKKDLKIED